MYIQLEALEEILKEKNMSQAQLAKRSGVSENTISNWKKGKEATKSYVERVAKALGTSVAKLTGANRSEKKIDSNYELELEFVSHHYGVSADTIIKLAPILFSVVARRALKKRLDTLEDWYKNLQDAATPPAGVSNFHDHYDNVEHEVSYSSFGDTYWHERERRENGDLSVDQYQSWEDGTLQTIYIGSDAARGHYGTDLFFQELFEIDTGNAISDYQASTANLKDCDQDYEWFYSEDHHDIPYRMCAVDKCTFDSQEEFDAERAADYLRAGHVRIPQIPTSLLKRGKEKELVAWINTRGKLDYEAFVASQKSDGGEDA